MERPITVKVEDKDSPTQVYTFTQHEIVLGRVNCDIVLNSTNVSKRHARIVQQEGRIFLVDLKSTNGTYLNQKRITTPAPVRPGDSIFLGNFKITLDFPPLDEPEEDLDGPTLQRPPPKPSANHPRPAEPLPQPPAGAAAPVNERTINLRVDHRSALLSVRSFHAVVTVDGPFAHLHVKVVFANDLGRSVDGELSFPWMPSASLRSLEVTTRERTLTGKVVPKDTVPAALRRGGEELPEPEFDALVRLPIAPIGADEDVQVELQLVAPLAPTTDGHRVIVPLAYMPRFAHENVPLTPAEEASMRRIRPITLAATAELHVRVRVAEGSPPTLHSDTHTLQSALERTADGMYLVARFEPAALDRDLLLDLRDRPSGAEPAVWIRHDTSPGPDHRGPSTAVAIVPPAFADEGETTARVVTFVIDRSGSMSDGPMQSAIRAVRACLRALEPKDLFNVVAFDDRLEVFARHAVPFTEEYLQRADRWISELQPRGGTHATSALAAALDENWGPDTPITHLVNPTQAADHALRILLFMTDGDVTGTDQVLRSARERLENTRLHVVGIGQAVQHAMLGNLARLGRGSYTPVATNEGLERTLQKLKNAIHAPLWTSIRAWFEVDGDLLPPKLLEPPGPYDLYASQALLFTFRGPLTAGMVLVLMSTAVDGTDLAMRIPLDADNTLGNASAALFWGLLRNHRLAFSFAAEDDAALTALCTGFGLRNRIGALVLCDAEHQVVSADLRGLQTVVPSGGVGPSPVARETPTVPTGIALPKPGRTPSIPIPRAPVAASGTPRRGILTPLATPRAGAMRPQPNPAPGQPQATAPAARSTPPRPTAQDEAATLRGLFLEQRADGLFAGDVGATLACISALVTRGHTMREGDFRPELRRTLTALRRLLLQSALPGQTWLALGVALLTVVHGEPLPAALPADAGEHLAAATLTDLRALQLKVRGALATMPPGWDQHPVARRVRAAFLDG